VSNVAVWSCCRSGDCQYKDLERTVLDNKIKFTIGRIRADGRRKLSSCSQKIGTRLSGDSENAKMNHCHVIRSLKPT